MTNGFAITGIDPGTDDHIHEAIFIFEGNEVEAFGCRRGLVHDVLTGHPHDLFVPALT